MSHVLNTPTALEATSLESRAVPGPAGAAHPTASSYDAAGKRVALAFGAEAGAATVWRVGESALIVDYALAEGDAAGRDLHGIEFPAAEQLAGREAADGAVVFAGAGAELRVALGKAPQVSLRQGGTELLYALGEDYNVGDVPQSTAFFRVGNVAGMCLPIPHQQLVYGGGEDFGSFVKNGRVVDMYNSDSLGGNGQFRYHAVPFFVMSSGLGVCVLNQEPSRADVGFRRHDILTWAMTGPRMRLMLVLPPTPNAPGATCSLLRKMIAFESKDAPGRIPAIPEWSLGLWLSRCYYQDQAELNKVLDEADENGVEASVIVLDARCWMRPTTRTDFVWDESRLDPYTELLPRLRKRGYNVCLWENPFVSSETEKLYKEGVEKGYFAKDSRTGEVYRLQWVPEGLEGFPKVPHSGLVDFTNPEARRWWQDQHRPLLEAGVRCFKTDFGEEIPEHAVFHDGSTGATLRNVYADLYNSCVFEVLDEVCGKDEAIVWSRPGWLRACTYPVKWGGDSATNWRGLRSTIRAGLSQAIGGALFWSHDVGGFYGPKGSAELYTRWFQVGTFGSNIRAHGTTPREPWEYGSEALETCKQYVAIRKALMPYWTKTVARCTEEATSFITPLAIAFPGDRAAATVDDQFMSGPTLMVAPFLEESGGRTVYLPKGRWTDLRTGTAVVGGKYIDVERTKHIPVFALAADAEFKAAFKAVTAVMKA